MATELLDRNGKPVKHNGKQVWRADHLSAVIKGVNKDTRQMWITGTTETKDRDGDIIMVNGWDVENYRKNPVFMYAHDYGGVPIGGTKKLVRRKEPKRMDHLVEFADMKDLWSFPELVMHMYGDGFLRASSVGFLPSKSEPMEKDPENTEQFWAGRRFLKQELLELSACAVPSNPEALAEAAKSYGRISSMDQAHQQKLLERLLDGDRPDKIKEAKQIIEHQYQLCDFEDEFAPFQIQVAADLTGGDREEKTDTNDPPNEEEKGEPPSSQGKIELVDEGKEKGQELTAEKLQECVGILRAAHDTDLKFVTEEGFPQYEEVKESVIVLAKVFRLIEMEPEQKVGAVLNKKNKERLQSALDNISEVLKSAETEEVETPSDDGKSHFEHLLEGEVPKTNPITQPPAAGLTDSRVSAALVGGEDGTSVDQGEIRFTDDDVRKIQQMTAEVRNLLDQMKRR